MTVTTDQLVAVGEAAGLTSVGVTEASPFRESRDELEERDRLGMRADLGFTYKDPDRSTDVTTSYPWARSLVVAGRSYLPESGSPGNTEPGTGRIARFAVTNPYQPLRGALREVASVLSDAGYRTQILCDDDRLVDRAAAIRAGIGWKGRSTNVIAPGAGPWMVLGSIVTDADLTVTPAMTRDCGTCTACIPACPTGALTNDGRLDARRCLAALTQTPGVFPLEFRIHLGDRIYGCDDCLTACPPGGRLLQISRSRDRGRVALEEILTQDDKTLRSRFTHFYLPKRSPETLRRNVLIAAGNSGDRSLVPLLAQYAGHPRPILRLHALWALAQLGGRAAETAIDHCRRRESDPLVLGDGVLAAG